MWRFRREEETFQGWELDPLSQKINNQMNNQIHNQLDLGWAEKEREY